MPTPKQRFVYLNFYISRFKTWKIYSVEKRHDRQLLALCQTMILHIDVDSPLAL